MQVRVKLCGLTTPAAVTAAVAYRADAVGFVFSDSPRRLSVDEALELAVRLPPAITSVAVFRHPDRAEVAEVVAKLRPRVVQSEPDEGLIELLDPEMVFLPVFHDGPEVVSEVERYQRDRNDGRTILLLEGPGRGGRGVAPDWSRAAELARDHSLVLAGGLDPDNVAEATRRVRPWAVDVSSGVESAPALKDPGRIARFIAAVRRTEAEIRRPEEIRR